MKLFCTKRRQHALTLVDLIVVLAVLAVFVVMTMNMGVTEKDKAKAKQISCLNNLKQIMLAEQMWTSIHSNKYPMDITVTNHGVIELAANPDAWRIFQVMSNELSTPKLLFCPANVSGPARDFGPGFNRTNISYFINLDAADADPQVIVTGDDNFEITGTPIKPGLLMATSNTPITWSATRHNHRGNIALSDGSVQSVTDAGLINHLHQSSVTTNRIFIP